VSRRAGRRLSNRTWKQIRRTWKQTRRRHLDRLGQSLFPTISHNEWLNRKLPATAALCRAPFVDHLVLEDWLLAQDIA
jgi:hypothetical protein